MKIKNTITSTLAASLMLLLSACSDENDLRDAVLDGNTHEFIELLKDTDIDVNKVDEHGYAPIHYAVKENNTIILNLLLNVKGIDINRMTAIPEEFECRERFNCKPLVLAAKMGHTKCVEKLLTHGAEGADFALELAAERGHDECVKLLVSVVDSKGIKESALSKATRNGHFTCVKILLEHFNTAGIQLDISRSTLHTATERGDTECVKLLLQHGAALECGEGLLIEGDSTLDRACRLVSDKSTLYYALRSGAPECVELILNSIPNEERQRHLDNTLIFVIRDENMATIETIDYLITTGANMTAGLDEAIRLGKMNVALYLIAKGADINKGILYAAYYGNVDVINMLLEKGANPGKGLQGAVQKGNLDTVKLMLQKGAKPNDGLWLAAYCGHVEIINYLLEQGADVNKALLGLFTSLFQLTWASCLTVLPLSTV